MTQPLNQDSYLVQRTQSMQTQAMFTESAAHQNMAMGFATAGAAGIVAAVAAVVFGAGIVTVGSIIGAGLLVGAVPVIAGVSQLKAAAKTQESIQKIEGWKKNDATEFNKFVATQTQFSLQTGQELVEKYERELRNRARGHEALVAQLLHDHQNKKPVET